MATFASIHRTVHSTGVVYHEDMAIGHKCSWDESYPECPSRCKTILDKCTALKLFERCQKISYRSATSSELYWLHSPEIVKLLDSCETKEEDELESISSRYDSIFISPDTNRLALLAAGSTLNLVKAICTDEVKNGMAIIRPPGHHAMTSAYCGYCFFNNVALAAKYALETFKMNRILIVDWDVHHGQATQRMFYNDPRVLYFSIHRFEHGTFWPNLEESNADYVGGGAGEGFNFNVPLNKTGLGNADYLSIFHQVLLPVTIEYQPDLIIVSAGYDAALGCFEGEMLVTPSCYAHFVSSLSTFAYGRIAVVLEGGYFLESLAEGAALTLRALLGDPCPDIGPVDIVDDSTRETILNVMYTHRKYWDCFKINDSVQEFQNVQSLFVPCIRFEHFGEVSETFPTRSCYPFRSEEINNYYRKQLEDLIKNTELLDVKKQCMLYSCTTSKNYEHILSMFEEDDILKITETENISSVALNAIMKNETRSVVIDRVEGKSSNCVECALVDHLIEQFNCKRILLVNVNTTAKLTDLHYRRKVLNFCFNQDMEAVNESYNINFKWMEELVKDIDYITCWLKIILPISYQYNPEITIISVDFGKEPHILPNTYAHLIHWLTPLANGRLILVADYNCIKEKENLNFVTSCHVLLGKFLPVDRSMTTKPSKETVLILKTLVENLQHKWSNLDYIVTFFECM